MKIGAVGLGNRIAHVYHELSKINKEAELIAYVDPLPIGKEYAEKHNFFPSKEYTNLNDMISNETLDLLMIGSPNHLHLEHIKIGLNSGIKIFAEKPIVVNENQSFQLAKLAESEDHHPRITFEWSTATIEWWSHKIEGLHMNDFICAAKSDEIYTSLK